MNEPDLRYRPIDPVHLRAGDSLTTTLTVEIDTIELLEDKTIVAIEWRPIFAGEPKVAIRNTRRRWR